MYFVCSDNKIVKKKKISKYFLKDGFKVNCHFFINKEAKKKNLVWAVHNRREPPSHLMKENGT